MPLYPGRLPSYGQFSVLAGDTLGINPSTNTRYFFAQNVNIDPTTGNSAYQHVCAGAAILTGFAVVATVAGTLDTGANQVAVSVRVNNATDYGTTNITFQSAQQTAKASGLQVPLAQGDQLQMTFLTPAAWTVQPTNVFFAGGISVLDA